MTKSDLSAQEWKEKGNEEFNKNNWSEALNCYTNALKLVKEDNAEKAIYYKNRAAAYLKLQDYEKVIKDCDDSLQICPNDPKALFRRCQALEALERFEEAYRDAKNIILFDPNNKSVQPIAARLHEIVQERYKENSRVSAKVRLLNQNAKLNNYVQSKKKLKVAKYFLFLSILYQIYNVIIL